MTGRRRAVVAALAGLGAVLAPAAPAAADESGESGGLVVSRVDVSHHPDVGFVVTPSQPTTLREVRAGLTVRVAGRPLQPRVTSLSAQDLQVVLVPDTEVPAAELAGQQAALTRLVLDLPARAQSGVLSGVDPTADPGLSADPTGSLRRLAGLAPGPPAAQPVARLQAALADFAPGAAVRRTVVMVTATSRPASGTVLDHLRRRLAASGTTLYVLDISADGRSPLAGLAAATGGLAVARRPGDDSGGVLAAAPLAVAAALARQYYVRFRDPAGLPHEVEVGLAGPAGPARTVVELPVANPVAPPPWIAPSVPRPPAQLPARDVVLILLGVVLVGSSLAYGMSMLIASRVDPERFDTAVFRSGGRPAAADLFFVFLLPCLNEDKVILASVRRLLSFTGDNAAIMIIDDDSDDDTAAIVSGLVGDRVWLLRRTAPHARQGKGEALNAAVRHLVGSGRLAGLDPDWVIVVVVDADGRLEPTALRQVAPHFADPTVAGVQTGVRINNRHVNLLARMQDMEFVIFTEVFQRGRRHLDSVGLGGNGQFMRLSALLDLGPAPWSRCLTEDLDLGVRLLARGWRHDFCSAAAVHQQGLVGLRGLVRQRTRWFQGHLQSWRLVPLILREAPGRARADLLYHLSSPLLLLVASLMTASFVVSLMAYGLLLAQGRNPAGWWLLSTYLLAFGPALAYSAVYWSRERDSGLSLPGAAVLAHVYVGYGLIWYVAGWRAVVRTLRGSAGWVKTERSAETPPLPVASGSGS